MKESAARAHYRRREGFVRKKVLWRIQVPRRDSVSNIEFGLRISVWTVAIIIQCFCCTTETVEKGKGRAFIPCLSVCRPNREEQRPTAAGTHRWTRVAVRLSTSATDHPAAYTSTEFDFRRRQQHRSRFSVAATRERRKSSTRFLEMMVGRRGDTTGA